MDELEEFLSEKILSLFEVLMILFVAGFISSLCIDVTFNEEVTAEVTEEERG